MNITDLPSLIRECVDDQASPVTVEEIKGRALLAQRPVPAQRPAPAQRRVQLGVAATGLAAAGIAGALVVTQAGGGAATTGTATTGTVLTAAMVRHLASASQTAMTSGQADIDWTSSGLPSAGQQSAGQQSANQQSVTQQISFDGSNWNDVMNLGQPAHVWHTARGIARTG
jgi:hypothetical protein